jgi:hypothetical protein
MIHILDLKNSDDLEKLKKFSELEHPSTFRYFKNRDFLSYTNTCYNINAFSYRLRTYRLRYTFK